MLRRIVKTTSSAQSATNLEVAQVSFLFASFSCTGLVLSVQEHDVSTCSCEPSHACLQMLKLSLTLALEVHA